MNTTPRTVSTDTLLQIAADPKRRTIVSNLSEHESTVVDVEELAEVLDLGFRRRAFNFPPGAVRMELRHVHLPKLADAGIIDFNRDDNLVRYHGDDRLDALLQLVSTRLE